ncbi:MAG: DNA polymerase III subunit epsilon [Azospirillaceae bacterium]|nr:DNA polymerase III subunit epsilon [Azospirillaceae bacterium]
MREIALDTETTGFDPLMGDRVVEIGCVELINHVATDRKFHCYLNPERDVPADAVAVHGQTEDFLADKPVFAAVVGDFLDFIADSPLIIHNAEFDIKFLNAELRRLAMPAIPISRAIDTVQVARRRFPGAPASLDALCRRFEIDNTDRTLHGALLDARLLAKVYLELLGGRQPGLVLAGAAIATVEGEATPVERRYREPRPHAPRDEEREAHAALLKQLKNPLWLSETA